VHVILSGVARTHIRLKMCESNCDIGHDIPFVGMELDHKIYIYSQGSEGVNTCRAIWPNIYLVDFGGIGWKKSEEIVILGWRKVKKV
jgi:hypothetical protein